MKTQKILRILILLVVILGLVACQSGGDSSAETNTPSPTPTQTSLPTPLPYLNVPEDYPTIQEAIDAVQDGGQVVVSPGFYKENIDFKGKNITVRSTDPEDPEVVASTIIDGGGEGSVVTFQSGESSEARLAGFTINNGSGSEIIYEGEEVIVAGGGILIFGGASPMIEGNTISGNQSRIGAGIAVVKNSSPGIFSNVITGNQAEYGGGGILVMDNSSPTITENEIIGNQAEFGGGIVVADGHSPTIIMYNEIMDNQAEFGGGIYVYDSSLWLEGNEIAGNAAEQGGGINLADGSSLNINNPDDNVYQNNQPDDVYYHGGTEEEEAVFEGLAMLGLEADETAINQMIANILANDPLDPCPAVQRVEDAAGTINPTYLVYISAQPEDFFLVVIHTIDTDMELYGSALFGTILEGENGNVVVSLEYPVPEGQTTPNEFEIMVVAPGCEIFTETVSYSDPSSSSDTSPFIGDWVAIDPGDGSNKYLNISEDNDFFTLNYYDDVASICGLDGSGNTISATATGWGFLILNGDELSMDISFYCMTDPQTLLTTFHIDYTYDETTDTIKDDAIIWSRR